jgi:hypothetical protein
MRTRSIYFGCLYAPTVLFLGGWVALLDYAYVAEPQFRHPPEMGESISFDPAAMFCLVLHHNLFFVALCWLGWGYFTRRFDPSRKGTVQTTPTGTRLQLSPLFRAGVLWLIVLSVVMCAFMVSALPTMARLLPGFGWWALGYFTLFGVVIVVSTLKRPPEGSYLLDDQAAGTVSWRVWRRKGYERRAVSRAAITGVTVREHEEPKSRQVTHQVVIHWQLPSGPLESDVICRSHRPADAEALAGWLRERLGLTGEPPPAASATR